MTKRMRITDLNGKETRYFTSNYEFNFSREGAIIYVKGKYLPITFASSGEHELALTIRYIYIYEMRNCILLGFKELGGVK